MSYFNQMKVSELPEMKMNYQNRAIPKDLVFMYRICFREAESYLLLGSDTVTATLGLCTFSLHPSPYPGGLQKQAPCPSPDFL